MGEGELMWAWIFWDMGGWKRPESGRPCDGDYALDRKEFDKRGFADAAKYKIVSVHDVSRSEQSKESNAYYAWYVRATVRLATPQEIASTHYWLDAEGIHARRGSAA